ncbi:hypothetical protein EF912_10075 [Streptomyces sp. WAC07061]|uniref:hypothetical protein n=1 Tax=Streptomyces sp. WAC07061 TaxID=2487410 RepID=UPI000F7984D1|nr:hypothetical protein [Streptomyces sp. WAC07061]RSS60461.1 hypothetical protein EF912_10075 [Streptomyces sp. WAC07061]
MQTHDENTSAGHTPLSTEDLAGTGGADGRSAPVYPGEASPDTGADTGTDTGAERDAGLAGEDSGAGLSGRDDEGLAGRYEEPLGREPVEPDAGDGQPLLAAEEAERYRLQWAEIQGRFVDDPKDAVTSADTLVAEVMQNLAGTFAAHKQDLEGQWRSGDRVPTEELRMALQHYRSFFNRLLKT